MENADENGCSSVSKLQVSAKEPNESDSLKEYIDKSDHKIFVVIGM